VFVEDGVVTLEGSVGDERVRHGLVVLAENTPGVARVRNEIAWIEPNSGLVLPTGDERAN
jgi:osmotically-inducible protein OsmY